MVQIVCVDISGLDKRDYCILYEKASAGRKAKADRYRWPEDAMRCVAAEALLRYALGTDSCCVETAPSGKPAIRDRKDFCFNLSHSGSWVVIAYGQTEVGIDVEKYRNDVNMDAIAERFFTPEEQQYCNGSQEEKRRRFFEIWTGKESYVKYLGTGLGKDLRSFSVLEPEEGVRIFHRELPDRASLSLCTVENNFRIELLDAKCLLSGEV